MVREECGCENCQEFSSEIAIHFTWPRVTRARLDPERGVNAPPLNIISAHNVCTDSALIEATVPACRNDARKQLNRMMLAHLEALYAVVSVGTLTSARAAVSLGP
jgi:hypothetical protein